MLESWDDRATLQTNVSRIKRKLVDKVGRLAADFNVQYGTYLR